MVKLAPSLSPRPSVQSKPDALGVPNQPIVPRVAGLHVGVDTLLKAAQSPWGMAHMALGGLAGTLPSAPYLLLKRVGPLCASPWAQATLLGTYVGLTLFAAQALHLVQLHVETRMARTLCMQNINVLAQAAKGRSAHLTNDTLAAAFAQQLGEGSASFARQIIAIVKLVPQCTVSLALGLWQLSTMASLSPGLMGAAVVLFATPLVLQWLFAGLKLETGAAMAHEQQGLQHLLAPAWHNMVIGLPANRNAWFAKMKMQISALADAKQEVNSQRTRIGMLERAPAQAITTLMNVSLLQQQAFAEPQWPISDAFIAGLSGLAQVQSSFWHVQFLWRIFNQYQQGLAIRQEVIDKLAAQVDLGARIDGSRIRFVRDGQDVPHHRVQAILDDPLRMQTPGLWTLRAPNGSGKTTFFALCKMRLGDDALFLPAKHQLDYQIPQGSSGQNVVQIFRAIDAMPKKPKLMCFDEWDANLDADNRALLAERIATWSRTCVVVQAVHRS